MSSVTEDGSAERTSDLASDEQRSIEQAAREARVAYESVRGLHEAFSAKLASVIEDCMEERKITVHSVTHRAKTPASFERKAAQPSPDDNPNAPKYRNPMDEITDKAGVRIITYFLSTLESTGAGPTPDRRTTNAG